MIEGGDGVGCGCWDGGDFFVVGVVLGDFGVEIDSGVGGCWVIRVSGGDFGTWRKKMGRPWWEGDAGVRHEVKEGVVRVWPV